MPTPPLLLALSLLLCLSTSGAYKVLVVFPLPGKSHGILGSTLVKHLINYGYEVTYITPFLIERPHPNLQQVDISFNLNLKPDDALNITSLMNQEVMVGHEFIMYYTQLISTKTLENENVQKLINDPEKKFDVVIIEWLFSELLTGLSAVFNAPLILLSSVEPHWIITRLIDDPLNPAYNGDTFSINVPPFSFHQRLQELWTQIKVTTYIKLIGDSAEKGEYDRLIAPVIKKRGREPPSYYDVKYNASLVLGNSHVSLGQSTTVPEAYKAVGGYHVDEEVLPLPPNIQHIMDKAKHGVIFFSLGSQINSKDMPEDLKKSLLELFGSLKQTVIWKFEEKPAQLPDNVHVVKWAPQQSILAHSNCVLFITHGGQLSTTEAIHFGVPIIGIPVFGDQFVNIARAVKKGFALKVKLSYSMADELKLAIHEILNNKIYKETVKRLSVIYHHRPVRPGNELVHWVEHVIITQGAPHLKTHGSLVPWYQKLYLDLIAILIALVLVIKRIFQLFTSKKISSSKKNN